MVKKVFYPAKIEIINIEKQDIIVTSCADDNELPGIPIED